MPIALPSTLTPAEVRAASRALRSAGLHLPEIGWSIEIPIQHRAALARKGQEESVYKPRRIHHDANGYFYSFDTIGG